MVESLFFVYAARRTTTFRIGTRLAIPVVLAIVSASCGWLVERWVGPDLAGALSSSAVALGVFVGGLAAVHRADLDDAWTLIVRGLRGAVATPADYLSARMMPEMISSSRQPQSPKVSIVTPVFNGEKYLRACIESVLAQTYENWDYTIVDNCSTDNSLAIAREYAERYPHVHVRSSKEHVGVVESHNRAFRSIAPDAKYCKVVCADDWLYPECVTRLVALAERHPSIGMVASYAVRTTGVLWSSLPLQKEVFAGREIGRLYLLGEITCFFVPSTVLYRASMVRATDAFFPGSAPSADLEACLSCLKESDLGFVHQILSFERVHDGSINFRINKQKRLWLDGLRILIEFGPHFLTQDEQRRQVEWWLSGYFKDLAVGCVNLLGTEFWSLHRDGLSELGYSIYDRRLVKALVGKALDLILNPKATAEKVVRRVKSRRSRLRRPDGGGDLQPWFG